MSTYVITGMTCDHCTAAVSSEVGAVPGVRRAQVDLTSGTLTVEGEGFTDEQVAAAVDEAGYVLA